MVKIVDEYGYRVRRGQAPVISIEQVLEELGWGVVAPLLRTCRGENLLIPDIPDELGKAIGLENASRLCERFRGRRCQIPLDGSPFIEKRDEEIRAERRAGATLEALKEKHQLTAQALQRTLRLVEG